MSGPQWQQSLEKFIAPRNLRQFENEATRDPHDKNQPSDTMRILRQVSKKLNEMRLRTPSQATLRRKVLDLRHKKRFQKGF
jgi:hypothetical protein